MSIVSVAPTSITAAALADRLAARQPTTVLDVRDDAAWPIVASSATIVHVPAARALSDLEPLAARLDPPVVVVCNRGMKAQPVAQALREHGVMAVVLEGGMRAWIGVLQARPVALGLSGLTVDQVQRPGRGCLSYLLAACGRALVVDPAPAVDFYIALAARCGARITDVVDTHLHADHLSGARALSERTSATLRLPSRALDRGVADADRVDTLRDGDELELGGVRLRAIALPGHTTDMTGLLVADRALIGGDSLFADGIARPDLERGDPDGARAMARTLHATLHDRVLALPDDIMLLPGHTHPGVNATAVTATVGEARAAIPELSIADAAPFAEAVLADMPPRPANYAAIIAANAGTAPFDPELETGGNSCSTR